MCRLDSVKFVGLILFLCLCDLRSAWAGPTYVYKEKSGVIRFTSRPPPSGIKAEVFEAKRSNFSWYSVAPVRGQGRLFRNKFNSFIDQAAQKYGVDRHLVRAVIHCESGFNPNARSPKGARGLMQLMPDRARLLGVSNSIDPQQNIDGGTRHLAYLLRRFKGNPRLALAAYNAGEEAVKRYAGIPPYAETQQYVPRVLHVRDRYATAEIKRHKLE